MSEININTRETGPQDRKKGAIDFLKTPGGVAAVSLCVCLLVTVLFIASRSGVEETLVAASKRFIPGPDSAPIIRSTANSTPRRLNGPMPIPISGMDAGRVDPATGKPLAVGVAGTAATGRAGPQGEPAALGGEPEANPAGYEEGEESDAEAMAADAAEAAGGFGGGGAASGGGGGGGASGGGGGGGGGIGALSASTGKNSGGGGGGAASMDGGRASKAMGSAAPAVGPRGAMSTASARVFNASGVGGGGPGAAAGGGFGRQQSLSGTNTTAAGAARFGSSQSGAGAAASAASPSGLVGAAAGASIGGSGGGVSAAGGSGVGEGGENATGGPGGGASASGNADGKIQGYGGAVSSYESMEPLTKGRGYVLCLIKAYSKRYHRGREQVNAMSNSVKRAALYFETPPPGGFLSKPVAQTLHDLHSELTSAGGLRTRFNTRADGLAKGAQCFPKEQDSGAQAKCNSNWEVPVMRVDDFARDIDTFNAIVGREGGEALKTLGQPVYRSNGLICPPNLSHTVNQPFGVCLYPSPTQQARSFLEQEITNYQNHLNAAKAEITGLDWGNDQDVVKMSHGYVGPHTMAKIRLNDILVGELEQKKQADWEDVARNANLKLEMASTGWGQVEGAGSQKDKVIAFVDASRETQLAAHELARGAAVLGLRPMPPEGQSPSAQFSAVADMPTENCDLPPCGPCQTRIGRTPSCTGSCPPSDDGKS